MVPKTKLCISLSESLVSRVDARARMDRSNRSACIEDLVKRALDDLAWQEYGETLSEDERAMMRDVAEVSDQALALSERDEGS